VVRARSRKMQEGFQDTWKEITTVKKEGWNVESSSQQHLKGHLEITGSAGEG